MVPLVCGDTSTDADTRLPSQKSSSWRTQILYFRDCMSIFWRSHSQRKRENFFDAVGRGSLSRSQVVSIHHSRGSIKESLDEAVSQGIPDQRQSEGSENKSGILPDESSKSGELGQPFHVQSIHKAAFQAPIQLEADYSTNLISGLTGDEVVKNREIHGSNEFKKSAGIWKILLADIWSVNVLVGSIILCFAFKQWRDGVIIICALVLSSIVASFYEVSAYKEMTSDPPVTAPVIRDNNLVDLDPSELVVGDLVVLETGQLVYADVRITEALDLRVNENLVSGCSDDVVKEVYLLHHTNNDVIPNTMCFRSTVVTSGYGRGLVVAVGTNVLFKNTAETNVKATPFLLGMERLGGILGMVIVIVTTIGLLAAYFSNYSTHGRSRFNSTLMIGVCIIIALMAQNITAILSRTFSLACKRLGRENIRIIRLPAIEALGNASAICTDKTGVITSGNFVPQVLDLIWSTEVPIDRSGGSETSISALSELTSNMVQPAGTSSSSIWNSNQWSPRDEPTRPQETILRRMRLRIEEIRQVVNADDSEQRSLIRILLLVSAIASAQERGNSTDSEHNHNLAADCFISWNARSSHGGLVVFVGRRSL